MIKYFLPTVTARFTTNVKVKCIESDLRMTPQGQGQK